jgi:hypothetical protein
VEDGPDNVIGWKLYNKASRKVVAVEKSQASLSTCGDVVGVMYQNSAATFCSGGRKREGPHLLAHEKPLP